VRGLSQQIAIGAEGSVFSINSEGKLQRWNNGQKRFRDLPGSLKQLAVDT